jgi:hypothetical protein
MYRDALTMQIAEIPQICKGSLWANLSYLVFKVVGH